MPQCFGKTAFAHEAPLARPAHLLRSLAHSMGSPDKPLTCYRGPAVAVPLCAVSLSVAVHSPS